MARTINTIVCQSNQRQVVIPPDIRRYAAAQRTECMSYDLFNIGDCIVCMSDALVYESMCEAGHWAELPIAMWRIAGIDENDQHTFYDHIKQVISMAIQSS